MPLSFGLWYDFRNPERWRQSWPRLYQETIEQAAWAESLGFGSIWLSEHHFTDDGYMPSLFPMLAALAMRTTRVRLGTAVLLAPLHHPLRLAEDAAVVDVLSGGRLDQGVAPGYRAREFALLGVTRAERGRRTEETLGSLDQADVLSRENYLVGTPDMIAVAISRLRREFPFDQLIFWARPPGLSLTSSSRSLELFAQQVLPRFAS